MVDEAHIGEATRQHDGIVQAGGSLRLSPPEEQSMTRLTKMVDASAPRAVVLIRIAVGVIFASEGIQKFIYADAQGAGRFERIGIPAPEITGPFVGIVEIVCGLLVLAGLFTRFAAVPLVVNMLVAIISTKVPILLGQGYWMFAHTFAPKTGFWSFLHESRTDLSMLLGSAFLLIVGAGSWSLDSILRRRMARPHGSRERSEVGGGA